MRDRQLLTALFFLSMMPAQAYAYCSEPSFYGSPPSPPGSYSKPNVPYCMNSYSGGGCDQWEIDSYISEVNDYIRKLSDYADEAADFANSTINFANDASNYASCEASDVKDQHQ